MSLARQLENRPVDRGYTWPHVNGAGTEFGDLVLTLRVLSYGHSFASACAYLVPLGLMPLSHVPARFRYAPLLTLVAVIMMGGYAGMGYANMPRPVFNVIGPLLSAAAAILLRDLVVSRRASTA